MGVEKLKSGLALLGEMFAHLLPADIMSSVA